MSKIKLLEIKGLPDGTRRFQSQLWVGSDSADFIIKSDGIIRAIGYGDRGENFYPFNGEYEIVTNKSDMVRQAI